MVGGTLSYLRRNALGALALFVALGGTTYAASGGFTASSGLLHACVGEHGALTLLKPGRHCQAAQKVLTWDAEGPRGAAGPAGASGPAGPAGATGATGSQGPPNPNAVTALTANNALSLDGLTAEDFTHSDCESTTGQIKGYALVPSDPGRTFQPVGDSYNCSGQEVEAVLAEKAPYLVRFPGNPATIAVATPIMAGTSGAEDSPFISVRNIAPGEFEVLLSDRKYPRVAGSFELLVP